MVSVLPNELKEIIVENNTNNIYDYVNGCKGMNIQPRDKIINTIKEKQTKRCKNEDCKKEFKGLRFDYCRECSRNMNSCHEDGCLIKKNLVEALNFVFKDGKSVCEKVKVCKYHYTICPICNRNWKSDVYRREYNRRRYYNFCSDCFKVTLSLCPPFYRYNTDLKSFPYSANIHKHWATANINNITSEYLPEQDIEEDDMELINKYVEESLDVFY